MTQIFDSLRDFIKHLEKNGDLKRISEPVSTHLEMTEIHRRVLESGGPALLFENVKDKAGNQSDVPVFANLFGTVERVAMAIGRKPKELREVGEMLAFLRQPEPPGSFKEALGMLPLAKKMISMKPKTVTKAPCQEIVIEGDDVDLSILPIQTCWPDDAAPLITWPLVVTRGPKPKGKDADPEDSYNLGIYRMQVTGKNTTLMRWLKHRGGAQQHKRWKENMKNNSPLEGESEFLQENSGEGLKSLLTINHQPSTNNAPPPESKIPTPPQGGSYKQDMPVAIVLGADPGTTLAAVTPIPDTLSEYDFAGLLRGKRVELVKCKTVPLKVPASAEIILEGYVSLDEYGPEGPFGDHTGFYNSVEDFPVFTCTAITMRKDPIYLSTYTGKPPDEPSILGEALNEIFIPLLQQQFPEIVDFWLPPEGCSYRVAVVSIKKSYPGHAKRVMMGVWSYLRQFMYTKFVIVVDDNINTRDWKEVIWAISTQMDPARDITLIENTPIDYLDFASPETGLGSKMGMDATAKIGSETHREWGEPIDMDQDIINLVNEKWQKIFSN